MLFIGSLLQLCVIGKSILELFGKVLLVMVLNQMSLCPRCMTY